MEYKPSVFGRAISGIMGLDLTLDIDVYPRSICTLPCVGGGVAMGRCHVQGLPSIAHKKKKNRSTINEASIVHFFPASRYSLHL
jgi:hypothetical protein